jgi:hypothetical protein
MQFKEMQGMAWNVKERHVITSQGKTWHEKARQGMERHGMPWHGMLSPNIGSLPLNWGVLHYKCYFIYFGFIPLIVIIPPSLLYIPRRHFHLESSCT